MTGTRAPFNVLVLPYRRAREGAIEYAVFHRSDADVWQFIAGGGDGDETPMAAARREAAEEGGIAVPDDAWLALDSTASIPRSVFRGVNWPASVYVVPQHSFAVNVGELEIRLSCEHDDVRWLDEDAASHLLRWDSNRVALWELTVRLSQRNGLRVPSVG